MRERILLGFSGKQFSGKTKASQALQNKIENDTDLSCVILSLGDMIKEMCKKGLGREDRVAWQIFGADIIRDGCEKYFGEPDFWVNYFLSEVNGQEYGHFDVVICDDVRFPNELSKLISSGFKVVRLISPMDVREGRSKATEKDFRPDHITETALDGESSKFRYFFDTNDCTPDELAEVMFKLYVEKNNIS